MSDKSENCPVCLYPSKSHTFQDFMDCIQKLFEKNEDNRIDSNPTKTKNQEAVSVITDLLKKTRLILKECDKDPNLNDLAIKYLLNQKQLLEKLKETLS